LAWLMLGGCTLSPVPSPTQRSGVTQQLLIRSLERALAGLDIEKLKSQSVAVEVFLQAGPETFVREFIVTWLRAHGVRTASESPELRIKAFASVFGTDSDQTLFGMPAFQAPFMSIPVPEIAISSGRRAGARPSYASTNSTARPTSLPMRHRRRPGARSSTS